MLPMDRVRLLLQDHLKESHAQGSEKQGGPLVCGIRGGACPGFSESWGTPFPQFSIAAVSDLGSEHPQSRLFSAVTLTSGAT